MATSKVWPSTGVVNVTPTTYSIPQAGNVNWASLTDFLAALSNGAQATTFQRYATRSASTTPVTVSTNDCVVACELAVPAPVAVTLPAGVNKQIFYVSDGTGDADTNNITITPNGSETIGGASSLVLNSNGAAVMLAFQSSDSDWKIVGQWKPNPSGGDVGGFAINRAIVSDGTGFLAAATTTATEIGYVNGVTSSIQTQLNAKEPTITILPIAKGGTNSGTALNNNRIIISSGSAIVESAAITASRALVSDTNGIPVAATTTAIEIGYVNGVTSAIQTQLNGKQASGNYITALTGDVTAAGPGSVAATLAATTNATLTTLSGLTTAVNLATVGTITSGTWSGTTIAINKGGTGQTTAPLAYAALSPLTTKGDIQTYSTTTARLGVGADGTVLTASSAAATGLAWTAPLTNPMTTVGDIIIGGASGAATRLAAGTAGQVLQFNGTTLAWGSPTFQTLTAQAANYIVGQGDATATTTGGILRGPARTGLNAVGSTTLIQASNGTGTAGSGSIQFQIGVPAASSSTANTLTTAMFIKNDGTIAVGQGNVSPSAGLDISAISGVSGLRVQNAGTADVGVFLKSAVTSGSATAMQFRDGNNALNGQIITGSTQTIAMTGGGTNFGIFIDNSSFIYLNARYDNSAVADASVQAQNSSITNPTLISRNFSTSASSNNIAPLRLIKGLNSTATSNVFIDFSINANAGLPNSGVIAANGANAAAFQSTSDLRLKENIVPLTGELAKITSLRPVEFDYKDGAGHQFGFVAQEMREVYPDVVSEGTTEEKLLSVTGWDKTTARLVAAIKELNQKFEDYVSKHP